MLNRNKSAKPIGRPRAVFSRDELTRLRSLRLSLRQIARQMHIGVGTVRRALQEASDATKACQNLPRTGLIP